MIYFYCLPDRWVEEFTEVFVLSKIFRTAEELIGNTPLMELSNIEEKNNIQSHILAKLEYLNPAGSVKDRVGFAMINDAEKTGDLKKGSVIIEPTSGNTGIGLASAAASKGYRLIIVMPDNMSEERIKLMRIYGAEIVLTDGSKGMSGAIEKANELAESIENSFIPAQFDNPSNPKIHFETTGPEIWADTDGNVDFFVAGIGTGGTITGTGNFLKSKNPDIKVIAAEPENSPVLSKGYSGKHKIQGIGADFVPKVLDTSVYDEIIDVPDDEAVIFAKMIAKTEGISVGISSGAALYAAMKIAKRKENYSKNIVVLFPDSGDRYYSTELFD